MAVQIDRMTDDQLIDEVHRLARAERTATAGLIRSLAEMDGRRLYLREGCPSLFVWCTQILHLSEAAAYNRIEVARIGRRFPAVFDALGEGNLTLTAAKLLGPYLTDENHVELLAAARHRTKREIEALLTGLTPVRPMPAGLLEATIHLAPGLHEIRFTITSETRDKLERARELLRHAIPNGEYAAIFDRALTVLLADVERRRFAAVSAPSATEAATSGSRYIPAAVRRQVWKRDGGQCAFVAPDGRRCTERGFLEFHHLEPFAAGGTARAENISLRCKRHNQHEAWLYFGAMPGLVRETRDAGLYGLTEGEGPTARELVPERVRRERDREPAVYAGQWSGSRGRA